MGSVRDRDPPPHVFEQVPHDPHVPTTQSTAAEQHIDIDLFSSSSEQSWGNPLGTCTHTHTHTNTHNAKTRNINTPAGNRARQRRNSSSGYKIYTCVCMRRQTHARTLLLRRLRVQNNTAQRDTTRHNTTIRRGCQGTISTGIISEGENVATSRKPEACCHLLVGFYAS